MEFRHPVDGMAADAGQVGHTDKPAPAFIDEGHPGHARLIAGVTGPNLIEEPLIDFVDDFEVPGKQAAEEVHRPFLQRFR